MCSRLGKRWTEAALEEIYAQVDSLVEVGRTRGSIIFIAGDWNAGIGMRRVGENCQIVGNFGFGDRKDRGDALVQWATFQKISIMNTIFQKHPDVQWTHAGGSDGCNKRLIDFVGVNSSRRGWVVDAGTTEDITLGADHRGLFLEFSAQVRSQRQRRRKKKTLTLKG